MLDQDPSLDKNEEFCKFVTTYCSGDEAESPLNFVHMYYCTFYHWFGSLMLFAYILIGALFFIAFMYLLSSTADDYLSNSLEYITIKSGINEALAGVTLLAFGNGAPDVFSSFGSASVTTNSGGNSMTDAMAILLGGAFFLQTFVMALTLSSAEGKKIKATKVFFLRESIFLYIVLIYLAVILFFIKIVSWFVCLGFIGIYLAYIMTAVYQSRKENKEIADDDRSKSVNLIAKDMVNFAKDYKNSHAGSKIKEIEQ